MARPIASVQGELDARVEELGFELVDVEWAGSKARPILRLRVDRPAAEPGAGTPGDREVPGGEGITVDECAAVSRGLEPWLDEHPDVPERYVLEVSSPGVNRPLVRPRDWSRFMGQEVVVVATGDLGGKGSRIEGELVAFDEEGDDPRATVRVASGEEIAFGLSAVKRANLLFRWE